jgi:hypothetical protein
MSMIAGISLVEPKAREGPGLVAAPDGNIYLFGGYAGDANL